MLTILSARSLCVVQCTGPRTLGRSAPNILSFTRSPISFINARPFSFSLNSAQATFCSVEVRSFLIYVFNWSESNLLGRGDVAPERGLAGDRMPGSAELAMRSSRRVVGVGVTSGLVVWPCFFADVHTRLTSWHRYSRVLRHHVWYCFSRATLFAIITPCLIPTVI